MKKICIVGTHGCGKSTLTYMLGTYYKKKNVNIKIVNETARSCPFPINENFTFPGAQWIVHAHITKELEAQARGYEIIITDRSPIDTIMYVLALDMERTMEYYDLAYTALQWMDSYDIVVWVSRIAEVACEDGTRSTDPKFRMKVHDKFTEFFDKENRLHVIKVSQSEIFGGNDVCLDIDDYGATRGVAKYKGPVGRVPSVGCNGFGVVRS